ncbi:MAG: S-layer homology domain-containing protein [Oscillospiraceae bacterium]|nr:S-layer homology domain-containing protein [Oscillospiraceae bacterium]
MKILTQPHRLGRRVLSVLLTVAMLLALLPVLTLPALAATGTMEVGGTDNYDLSTDPDGTGWSWDASSATLTLDNTYSSGDKIFINCGASENITLLLAGDVTINYVGGAAIAVAGGNLTIKAGSHTLDVTAASDVIYAGGSIVIESGTIAANGSGAGRGIVSATGSVTITGSANVTANGGFNGIEASGGDVIISTSGTVNASGGTACGIRADNIQIASGTVTAKGSAYGALNADDGSGSITITDGTVVTDDTGGNGDVNGNLTLPSNSTASVTVNGDISGNLTVANGTVVYTDSVSGTTTHTGGTINGEDAPPAAPPPYYPPTPTPTPKPEETEEPEETPAPEEPIAEGIPLKIEQVNAYTDETFPDVSPDDWFAEAVQFVYEYGIFNGTDKGFEPSAKMSRAMLITALARAAGVDTIGGESWYEIAVEWAKENGVSDGTNLTGEITREQLVTMLWRFAGSPSSGGAIGFGDADDISDYASDAIAWAVENGIVNGKPGNIFDPQGGAARAEVAAALQRFAENAAG